VQLYHLGYEVGRYISLERLIEENKDRYYETLEQSSQGWHDGKQDPWPYIGYALYTLKTAYKEFESRVGQVQSPRGEKTAVVVEAVNRQSGTFSVADIQHSCPGVSIDMIRQVLKDLRPKVECLGRGRNARWQKTKRWN
jgi:Fic family protein